MPSSLRPGFAVQADSKQTAELYMRISQETFDAAVQENIEDLDMNPEEALADAIEQFESQGVKLDNIVQRVPGASGEDDPPVLCHVRTMEGLLNEAEDEGEIEIEFGTGHMKVSFARVAAGEPSTLLSQTAAALKSELQADKQNLTFAGHNGGVDALVSSALSLMEDAALLPPVMEALAAILMDAENRERFGVRGIAALSAIVRRHVGGDAVALRSSLLASRASLLVHEHHRQLFVGSADLLGFVVQTLSDFEADTPTVLAACGVLRAVTLSDDARSRTSKGLEHAKAAVELGVLPKLLALLRSPMASSSAALAELLATLSRLTVTDKICAQLADMDALELAIGELANHVTDASVAKQACFFLANISGNDACKTSIVAASGHVAIVQAMLLHPNNGAMQVDAIAALGNMALRMPLNCEAIAEAGGLPPIVAALTQHLALPRMQSKGCLTVRNLVSRNQELIEKLLELGVEQPLRIIHNGYEEGHPSHNLAKAALRELHCSVQLQEGFKGQLGASFKIAQGDMDGENHWDTFMDTPAAQAAVKEELKAYGVDI